MNRAVEVLASKQVRGRAAPAAALKDLGEHPEGGAIQVLNGRFGPYVKWGKINATLPRDVTPENIDLEKALELIAAKAAKGGKGARKPAAKAAKSDAAKPTAKKTAAKKPVAKKSAAKKPATKAKAAKKADGADTTPSDD